MFAWCREKPPKACLRVFCAVGCNGDSEQLLSWKMKTNTPRKKSSAPRTRHRIPSAGVGKSAAPSSCHRKLRQTAALFTASLPRGISFLEWRQCAVRAECGLHDVLCGGTSSLEWTARTLAPSVALLWPAPPAGGMVQRLGLAIVTVKCLHRSFRIPSARPTVRPGAGAAACNLPPWTRAAGCACASRCMHSIGTRCVQSVLS